MNHYISHLESLNRPRLLIRAARAGLRLYRREKILGCLPGIRPKMGTNSLVETLIAIEQSLDDLRRNRAFEYDVQKHILSLTALIAETADYTYPELEIKMAA